VSALIPDELKNEGLYLMKKSINQDVERADYGKDDTYS